MTATTCSNLPGTAERSSAFGRAIGLLPLLFYFIALHTLFFSPILLNGRLLAHGDGEAYFHPMFRAPKAAWTANLFGGYPLSADPQVMSFYPPARLMALLPNPAFAWNLLALSAFILGSFFMAWFVLALTGNRLAGLAAGTIYGLGGVLVSHVSQVNMTHTAAWLPLLFLAALRLRQGAAGKWFVTAALAVGLCILAGHPQWMVYSLTLFGSYVLVLAAAGPGDALPISQNRPSPWRYLLLCALAVVLGILLAAIQLLPAWQLTRHSVRQTLTYENFSAFSFPPRQFLTLLFPFLLGGTGPGPYPPYIGLGNFTEMAGYVGLLPLILAAIALWRRGKSLHTRFFAAAAAVALLMALGDYTPLAKWLFHLPGYNLFRIPPRHLFEWTVALSILAGLGLAALASPDRKTRRRIALVAAVTLPLLMAMATILLFLGRSRLQSLFAAAGLHYSPLPWHNPTLAIPLIVALLGAIALALIAWSGRSWAYGIALLVLILDLASFSFLIEWRSASPPAAELHMPAPLARVGHALSDTHQRIGMAHDMLGKTLQGRPNSPFAWGLSSATGYNPLLLQRYQRLTRTDAVGALTRAGLLGDRPDGAPLAAGTGSRALDLLAMRYLLVPDARSCRGLHFDRDGYRWNWHELPLLLQGGLQANADRTIAVSDFPADHLGLVGAMGNSILVPDNTPVLRITLEGADGQTCRFDLRAGRDIAEQAWDRPDVRPLIRHRRAPVFSTRDGGGYPQHFYLARFTFPHLLRVQRIRLHCLLPDQAAVILTHITLRGPADAPAKEERFYPISPFDLLFTNAPAWKAVDRFDGMILYENRRAMPRAWLTSRTIQLPPDQVAHTIVTGRLPDGTPFDPATTALLEKTPPPLSADASTAGRVNILKITPTTMDLQTDTPHPAFLVLSDVNYPGWEARIDGQPTPIYQTDYLLRGLPLPAGHHSVRFTFRSKTLYAGAALSAAALLSLIAIAAAGAFKTRWRRDQ